MEKVAKKLKFGIEANHNRQFSLVSENDCVYTSNHTLLQSNYVPIDLLPLESIEICKFLMNTLL
jgi:hypothetical protein